MELPFWSRACLLTFISNWLYKEGHDLKIIFYPGGKGGVARLYFCFHKEKKDTIIILDIELKKKNKAIIETAKERKKEYD